MLQNPAGHLKRNIERYHCFCKNCHTIGYFELVFIYQDSKEGFGHLLKMERKNSGLLCAFKKK